MAGAGPGDFLGLAGSQGGSHWRLMATTPAHRSPCLASPMTGHHHAGLSRAQPLAGPQDSPLSHLALPPPFGCSLPGARVSFVMGDRPYVCVQGAGPCALLWRVPPRMLPTLGSLCPPPGGPRSSLMTSVSLEPSHPPRSSIVGRAWAGVGQAWVIFVPGPRNTWSSLFVK